MTQLTLDKLADLIRIYGPLALIPIAGVGIYIVAKLLIAKGYRLSLKLDIGPKNRRAKSESPTLATHAAQNMPRHRD